MPHGNSIDSDPSSFRKYKQPGQLISTLEEESPNLPPSTHAPVKYGELVILG
ncbi:hypothetical protein BSL78_08360, partial [Apostichopus japonicus]